MRLEAQSAEEAVVSMEPRATSQFFICVSDEPQFDGNYTIFGRVISGMEVIDRIAAAPLRTDDKRYRERPVDPVAVTRAYLVPATRVGNESTADR
jgi:cyclophilin family peptidyl-prolyl cis-trans isomerase